MTTGSAIGDIIAFVLGNFTLTFLVIGLIFSLVGIARAPKPLVPGLVSEELFRWFLFWSIGVSNVYNWIFHVFLGEMTASLIGWEDSPFQAEVGWASLGMALVGFYAFRNTSAVRLAAILGPAAFLWGAAAGHVYQIITAHNFAPGNAGVILWTDILIPLIGFVLWWLTRPATKAP
jgi:hypothetical protein